MKVATLLIGFMGLCRGEETPGDGATEPKPSEVVVLTNSNFEHDTQVTSGATTGDWFVKFYAPWCGHCKALAPAWDEVALELKAKADEGVSVNVAKVDVTAHSALGKRFEVKGFPTLIFFSKGMMYKYPAGKEWPRDKEHLLRFALGEYKDAAEGELTPPPPNLAEEIKKAAAQFAESAKFYAANPGAVEENEWGFLVTGFGMGAVVASGLFLTLRMFMGPSLPKAEKKAKGE